MLLPLLLPQKLFYLKEAKSPQDILDKLLLNSSEDFILFLELAVDDRTWLEEDRYQTFDLLFLWLSDNYLKNKIEKNDHLKCAAILVKAYPAIKFRIPESLLFETNRESFSANGFLFGASSDYIHERIVQSVYLDKKKSVKLSSLLVDIDWIKEYVYSGALERLNTASSEQLMAVIQQSFSWQIIPLLTISSHAYRRYLTPDNVFKILVSALKDLYFDLASVCCDFINNSIQGMRFDVSEEGELQVDISDNTRDNTLALIQLKLPISHLGLHGQFMQENVELLKFKIKRLNLKGLDSPNDEFLSRIPQIESLNLSSCPWLTDKVCVDLINRLPSIQALILSGNPQISIEAMGSLYNLRKLKHLDLKECNLDSDVIDLIKRIAPAGTEIVV